MRASVSKIGQLLALFLLLALPVNGQGVGRLPMKSFGVEHGLNSEVVWALAQDRQGVIWAGTDVGLHRFDGRRFEPFEGALPSAKVQSLWASPKGDLFVGTLQGLAKISKGRVHTFGAADGLPPQAILRIGMDEKGALWVLSDQGIFRESAPGLFSQPSGWPEGAAASALWCLPEGGRILVGRGRFVGTWNAVDSTWKWEVVDLLGPSEGLASVGMDGAGSLWVKTSSGRLLHRHEGDVWQAQKSAAGKSLESISEMETDRDGWVWVDSSHGLIRLKGRELDLPSWDLPYIAGSNVLVDREGTRWVRSPRGIFRTAGQGLWESFGLAQGLPSPLVFQPLRDRAGRLWLGTRSGLCLATPQGWRTVFSGGQYLWLDLAADGALWTTGAPGGIVHRIDPERLTEESFRVGPISLSQNARGVVVDAQGRVWLGDKAGGLAVGIPGPRGYDWSKVEGPGAPTGVITSMFKDRLGRLIVLHENKVSWLVKDRWESLPNVLEEGPYQMAFGAEGDLFVTYRNSSKITRHRQTNGSWKLLETIEPYRHMANMMIYSIAVDSCNRLWMGTNRGVGRYDLTDRSLALFGPMDGLPSSDCVTHALLVDPNLDVWVGTVAGLAHFSGSLERPTPELPAPLLLGVRETRGGTLLDAGDLELAPGSQGLEVQFVVPSYLNPSRLGFEARIRNSDNPWRPLSEPVARFGALSPGTHVIEIRGTYGPDHPGAVLSLRIAVLPAWHESWWARALMVVVCLGLIGGVYVLRIQALSRKNAHLQELVAHRTDLLHKALDRAERASNFKSLFLATTTHELRTPLNAILGFSKLITGGSLPEGDAPKYANHVHGAAANMLQLVNDLLDLSKIEAGQLRVVNKPFEPRQVVDEAMVLLANRAAEKGLELAADINPNVPAWALGDAFRVRQMLVNLLSNAVKFTDFGWIHIELSFDGENLKVAVTDTGPGVPKEVLPTLFQAYQQGETAAKQQGTGLGLSITRQLAQLMGGNAGAENAPSGGAVFWFSFRAEILEASDHPLPDPRSHEPHQELRGRVLVADDNLSNRLLAGAFLGQLGLDHVELPDGRQALAALAQEHFDVVILDGRMPGLSGPQTKDLIRALPGGASLPILLFTATLVAQDHSEGFDGVLQKPADPEDFRRVLSGFLGEASPPKVIDEAESGAELSRVDRLRIALGGEEGLQEYLQTFRQDALRRLESLRAALASEDRDTLSRQAHDLKSNAGSLGLESLRDLAEDLEERAADAEIPWLEGQVDRVEGALRSVFDSFGWPL